MSDQDHETNVRLGHYVFYSPYVRLGYCFIHFFILFKFHVLFSLSIVQSRAPPSSNDVILSHCHVFILDMMLMVQGETHDSQRGVR